VNLQNWYFTGNKNTIHAYSSKAGFLRSRIGGGHFPVNMGIALYHLKLATEHYGMKIKFIFDPSKNKSPPKNLEYIATLEIKQTS